METDGQMGYSYGFHHGEDDRSFDEIPRGVLPMRLERANVEIGQVTRAGS